MSKGGMYLPGRGTDGGVSPGRAGAQGRALHLICVLMRPEPARNLNRFGCNWLQGRLP